MDEIEIILYVIFFIVGIKIAQLIYRFYPKMVSKRDKYRLSEYEYFKNRCVQTLVAFILAFGSLSYTTYFFFHAKEKQSEEVANSTSIKPKYVKTRHSPTSLEILKEVIKDSIQEKDIEHILDTNSKRLENNSNLNDNKGQDIQKDSIKEIILDIQREHRIIEQAYVKNINTKNKKKYYKKRLFNAYLIVYKASNIERLLMQVHQNDSVNIELLQDLRIIQKKMLSYKNIDTKDVERNINKVKSVEAVTELLKREVMSSR